MIPRGPCILETLKTPENVCLHGDTKCCMMHTLPQGPRRLLPVQVEQQQVILVAVLMHCVLWTPPPPKYDEGAGQEGMHLGGVGSAVQQLVRVSA